MIQQHIYTRCNRGLFTHGAGYDSAAKSAGLSESDLQSNMLRAMSQYPETGSRRKRNTLEEAPVILLHCADARAEAFGIARVPVSVYGGNIGKRIAFMHQYIACGHDMLPLDDPQRLLLGTAFRDCYDERSEGGVLPELDALPRASYTPFTSLKDEVALTKDAFFSILGDVLWVLEAEGRNLVFLEEGEPAEISGRAARKLAAILCVLPTGLRKRLTFCSYWPTLDMSAHCRVIVTSANALVCEQTGDSLRIVKKGAAAAPLTRSMRGFLELVWSHADDAMLTAKLTAAFDDELWLAPVEVPLAGLLNVKCRLRAGMYDIRSCEELLESMDYLTERARKGLYNTKECEALMGMIIEALPGHLSFVTAKRLSDCTAAMEESDCAAFRGLLNG